MSGTGVIEDGPSREDLETFRCARHDGGEFVVDSPDVLGLSMCLTETFATECRVNGTSISRVPRVGDFALLAPGHPVHVRVTGRCCAIQLWLPIGRVAGLIEVAHGVDGDRIEFRPGFEGFDLQLFQLVADGIGHRDPIAREEAIVRVADHLWHRHAVGPGRARASVRHRGGLAPARLKRVTEFVEERLDGPLTLSALAAEASLSPYHFAREFQRSIGRAPHRYVVERRAARALTLLGCGGTTLTEAARRTGFSHASHLSRNLQALFGLRPSTMRELAAA